jgi:hypothetical protein
LANCAHDDDAAAGDIEKIPIASGAAVAIRYFEIWCLFRRSTIVASLLHRVI